MAYSQARTAATTASTASWNTHRSTRTSRHSGGRAGRRGRVVAVSVLRPGRAVTSAVRRGVQQAAVGPQRVDAALEPERGEVPLEDLAVVPDLLDDLVGEVDRQPETGIERRRLPSSPVDLGAEEGCRLAVVAGVSISSTLAGVMPNSSAWIVAMIAQLTACAHCVSPSATAGASGSFEKTSGRIVSASGPSG